MKECEKCGGDVAVIDSRVNKFYIRRRRACVVCDYRFSTYEVSDKFMIDMIRISKRFIDLRRRLTNDPFIPDAAQQINSLFSVSKKGRIIPKWNKDESTA